jgi:hypothetical protein
MNPRILTFALVSVGILPEVCSGQMSIPMRNSEGGKYWLGPQGATPFPVYTPQRPLSVKPPTRQRQRMPVQPRPTHFQLLADREYHAPNLGIQFKLVRVGNAAGAMLTAKAVPDAGVTKIWVNGALMRLEPGDVISKLDSLPIRAAVDVMNHHGRTFVSFIDKRSGKSYAGVMALPSYTPLPDDAPEELFATNLGIHYQLIGLGGDAFGARLSRTISAGTPADGLRLERGDMIVKLDGQPIRSAEDLLSHVSRTSVDFINIRTGRLQSAYIQLPGEASTRGSSIEPLAAAPN